MGIRLALPALLLSLAPMALTLAQDSVTDKSVAAPAAADASVPLGTTANVQWLKPGAHPLLLPHDPLAVFAYQSDLIVVGNIMDQQPAHAMPVRMPGDAKPILWSFSQATINISNCIKTDPQNKAIVPQTAQVSGGNAAALHVNAFIAQTTPPNDPAHAMDIKNNISTVMEITEACMDVKRDAMFVFYMQHTQIAGQYVLIKATPFNQRGDDSAARDAADVNKWPWGKSSHGLQIAVFPCGPLTRYANETNRTVQLRQYVALRNAGDKPLAIDMHSPDNFLTITATDKNKTMLESNFYPPSTKDNEKYDPSHSIALQPGEIHFIGPHGALDTASSENLPLTAGTWNLQATYFCRRQAAGMDKLPLWNGQADSAIVPLEVKFETEILNNSSPVLNTAVAPAQ